MAMGANIPIPVPAVRAALHWTGGPGIPDVDASALLLLANGQVGSDADFVFYNQAQHASGAVRMAGRTPPPQASDAIDVDLSRVPAAVPARRARRLGRRRHVRPGARAATGADRRRVGSHDRVVPDARRHRDRVRQCRDLPPRRRLALPGRSGRATRRAWPGWPPTSASPSAVPPPRRRRAAAPQSQPRPRHPRAPSAAAHRTAGPGVPLQAHSAAAPGRAAVAQPPRPRRSALNEESG